MTRRTPPEERIQTKYSVDNESGCWVWIASCDKWSRPGFYDGERSVDARRWMIEYVGGETGPGVRLYHALGDISAHCINPDHWAVHQSTSSSKGPQFFDSLGILEQFRLRHDEAEVLAQVAADDITEEEFADIADAMSWFD
jgi:hypothetical protein